MLSLELSQVLQTILKATEEAKAPHDLASYLDEHYPTISNPAIAILSREVSQKSIEDRYNKLDALIDEMMRKVLTEKPAQVLVSLDRWMRHLGLANDSLHTAFNETEPKPLDSIIARVKHFHDMYENLLQSHTKRNLLYLVFSAHELVSTTQTAQVLLTSINDVLQVMPPFKEGFRDISLFFPTTPSVDNLIQKLSALEALYEELCRLLDVSTNEYPLEIIKVEAGSLWLKIFGESRVISLITKFVESTASYLYRNFTSEGKLTAIPQKVDVINSMLKLSDNLEQSGIDTSVLNENIQQSSIIVAQQLNQLLAGEPAVNVNGESYSVGDEWDKRFIKESRTRFIGSGSDSDNVT